MLIQVYDSLDGNYVGGIYKVTRNDGGDQSQHQFIDAWARAVEQAKSIGEDWGEDDIFEALKEFGWEVVLPAIDIFPVQY